MVTKRSKGFITFCSYSLLIIIGFAMLYPLLWMISATFKNNAEIFTNMGLIPHSPTFDGYKNAMKSYGGNINIIQALLNTFKYVIPKVIFTVISTTIVAYGFSRYDFKGRKIVFSIMISTLFLPQVVLNVPQYILFTKLNWVNSPLYLSLIVPALFAVDTYFVFMLIQFLRTIPKDLDEAAKIDGCNDWRILTDVIVPMLQPAMVSCALFQFMWSSNDFMGPLLYVKTPANFPATIFVKLSMDADSGFDWNRILALSLISIIPSLVVFFAAQNQFVDGISAGGIKG